MSKVKYVAIDDSGEVFTGVVLYKAPKLVGLDEFRNIEHIITEPKGRILSFMEESEISDLREKIWNFIDGRIKDDEVARSIKFPNGIVQLELVDDD